MEGHRWLCDAVLSLWPKVCEVNPGYYFCVKFVYVEYFNLLYVVRSSYL